MIRAVVPPRLPLSQPLPSFSGSEAKRTVPPVGSNIGLLNAELLLLIREPYRDRNIRTLCNSLRLDLLKLYPLYKNVPDADLETVTKIFKIATTAIKDPTNLANLQACHELVDELGAKPNAWRKLRYTLQVLAGVALVLTGATFAVMSLGLLTPVMAGVVKLGVLIALGGLAALGLGGVTLSLTPSLQQSKSELAVAKSSSSLWNELQRRAPKAVQPDMHCALKPQRK